MSVAVLPTVNAPVPVMVPAVQFSAPVTLTSPVPPSVPATLSVGKVTLVLKFAVPLTAVAPVTE